MSRRSTQLLRTGLVAAVLFFVALIAEWKLAGLVLKPIPVLCVLAWLWPLRGADARRLRLGLVLSVLGDVLLAEALDLFIAGLAAFLLAHVAYVAAFVGRTRALHLLRLAPIAVFGWSVYGWLAPNLGELRGPVLAYVIVICAMMWRAAAQVGERPGEEGRAWAGLAGAIAFALSDTLIAVNRFIAWSLGVELLLMVLYWVAQVLIASSVAREE
ncbi:lysoplasmalogenase [Nannocystis pusilla]|uniref:Lysoplasmalogenase n=1 Tax=Nannocystis pusilla TaxID=889268 RepID=A0A9X3EU82_9BACT|nr:lysoplasmalogenase [Nannocystis pusilla]